MFNESLFQQFKQLLDQTFGENFFDITVGKTPDNFKRRVNLDDWGVFDNLENFTKYCDGGRCTPYDSYFACILKPIRIPTGSTVFIKIGRIGSKYHFYGELFRHEPTDIFVNRLSDVLKEQPFLTFLRLLKSDTDSYTEHSSDKLLSVDDVDFLYSLKGHQILGKFSVSAEKRMRSIGNRFPKGNYQYLYRGIVNETFYNEIEDSFETTCSGGTEELLLEKDLSVNAKRYFKVLVSGVRSWTYDKETALRYAEAERPGGYVLLAWVRPPKEDMVIDVKPTLKYIRENSLSDDFSWALHNEILAEPTSFRIAGIKRWSDAIIHDPNVVYHESAGIFRWPCKYVIYIKS